MDSRTPTWAEVINGAIAASRLGIHTSIPGKVVRYDKALQQADIQPLIQVAYEDEEGNRVSAQLPVIPNCPVQFAGGGGLSIKYPLHVGDEGVLVFSQASLDKWLSSSTTDSVDPGIDHDHHLSDGMFIPGVRPFTRPLSSPDDNAVVIGQDSASPQGAALGDVVKSFLDDFVSKYNGHTHVTSCGAGAGTAVATLATESAVPTIASATVKITP